MGISVPAYFGDAYNRLEARNEVRADHLARLRLVVDDGRTDTVDADGTHLRVSSAYVRSLSKGEMLAVLDEVAGRLVRGGLADPTDR